MRQDKSQLLVVTVDFVRMASESREDIATKADELEHILTEIDAHELPSLYPVILRLVVSFLESGMCISYACNHV